MMHPGKKAVLLLALVCIAFLFGCLQVREAPVAGGPVSGEGQPSLEQPPPNGATTALEGGIVNSEDDAFNALESELENLEDLDTSELESYLTE